MSQSPKTNVNKTPYPESGFDPVALHELIDSITPAQFGVLVARYIQKDPSSTFWFLVGKAVELHTGMPPEWDEIEMLINKIAHIGEGQI